MVVLKNSKTFNNLARAFVGECQARTRYEFIEFGARQQGYKNMADIIDEIAYNEFNHSRMFYSFIQSADKETIKNINIEAGYPFKEKWDLLENLKFAAEAEDDEATKIYPEFARVAKEEGFEDVANLFLNVIEVEKQHKAVFIELYNQMRTGTLYKKGKPVTWKCADCGYAIVAKEAFEKCPVCQAKQGAVYLHVKAHTEPPIEEIKESMVKVAPKPKTQPRA